MELVRSICEDMGEPFELRTYERFGELHVEAGGLARGYEDVQPGDCVVAFRCVSGSVCVCEGVGHCHSCVRASGMCRRAAARSALPLRPPCPPL